MKIATYTTTSTRFQCIERGIEKKTLCPVLCRAEVGTSSFPDRVIVPDYGARTHAEPKSPTSLPPSDSRLSTGEF